MAATAEAKRSDVGDGADTIKLSGSMLRQAPTPFEQALAERVGDLAARLTNLELLVRVRREAKQGPDGIRYLGGFTRVGYERVAKQVTEELLSALLKV